MSPRIAPRLEAIAENVKPPRIPAIASKQDGDGEWLAMDKDHLTWPEVLTKVEKWQLVGAELSIEGALAGCDSACIGRVLSTDNQSIEFGRSNGQKLLHLTADNLPLVFTCSDGDDLIVEDRNQQGRIRISPRV